MAWCTNTWSVAACRLTRSDDARLREERTQARRRPDRPGDGDPAWFAPVFRRRNGVLLLVVELLDGSPGTVRADATNIFAAAPMAPTGLVLDGDGPGSAWSGCGVATASGVWRVRANEAS